MSASDQIYESRLRKYASLAQTKKKRRYFYDPAGTHMQMRCMCEEAVGVLVGAAMSACLPAAAASGGGAGTARYE